MDFDWNRLGKGVDASGNFWLQASIPAHTTVVLEYSTNLSQWVPIQTNDTGGVFFEYATPVAPGPKFYRLLLR